MFYSVVTYELTLCLIISENQLIPDVSYSLITIATAHYRRRFRIIE